MLVRFWGTRGSIATPGVATARFGGNTSCVEVRSGETLVILDCGTGARALGAHLAAQGGPQRAHLMLTHFHWDHIQGFPFFLPVFLPGSEVHVYGAPGQEQGLEEALAGQMQYTYFPVRLADLRSRPRFHEVDESTFQAERFTVRAQYLNHTCPTVGYRLTAGGTTIAYITDHEPFWPHNPDLPLADALVHPGDQRHAAFFAGADLLIHDAQYVAEEYPAKRGWGHSTVEYVVDVAVAAGVRRLALFHHDPSRDDGALERVVARAQACVRARGADLEVFAAAEGMALDLPERGAQSAHPAAVPLLARAAPARVALLGPPELRHSLRQALAEDGFRLIEAELDHPLSGSLVSEPDLIVVAPPPEADVAMAVGTASKAARGQPVMAVLDGSVDEHVLRQIGEFAADVVVAPCSPPNLRARVRACLARRVPSVTRPPVTERPALMDTLQLADRLSAAELEGMLQVGTRCGFRPGEMMFRQGDPPTGVYYLHAGLVRLVVQGDGGREVTVGFAGAGDMVGEMSVLDGAPRSASALAMESVDASYVPRDAFHQTLERVPQASVRLLRMLTRRLRDADQRLARGAPDGRAAENESATPSQQTADMDETVASAHLADLEEALEREVHRARRLRYPIGLLTCRVERADPGAGLDDGSLYLSALAAALQDALRGTEVVASSPAGDLGIILPGLPPEGLARVEARVRRAIQYALEGHGLNEARLEVRVGGSVVQPEEADARRLLERAFSSLHASAQL